MRSAILGVCMLACSGIQGGSEGSESDRCTYDSLALSDPDAVPEGFQRSPRELLAVTSGPFAGRLANGRAVTITFTPEYAGLHALYASAGVPADCGPHLATSASATLNVDGVEQTTTTAALEIRWGHPLASARFDVAADAPFASVQPTFSAPPVTNPMLNVWLTTITPTSTQSEWKWTAFVACSAGSQCTGGPGPGGAATNGVEVNWGKTKLARE
ncbi:MAG: hypothetical protein ACOY0T_18675 [Myxococcota bacterium]